jgi:hypothetical protein
MKSEIDILAAARWSWGWLKNDFDSFMVAITVCA